MRYSDLAKDLEAWRGALPPQPAMRVACQVLDLFDPCPHASWVEIDQALCEVCDGTGVVPSHTLRSLNLWNLDNYPYAWVPLALQLFA